MQSVLAKGMPKRTFAEQDQTFKTFFFNRANKPFRVGITPRRPWRTSHWLDARSIEGISEGLSELRGPIHNVKRVVPEEAIEFVGELARDLHHERTVGVRRCACNGTLSCRQLDHKQHVISDQTFLGVHTSMVKQSVAAITSQWAFRKLRQDVRLPPSGARAQYPGASGCWPPCSTIRCGRDSPVRPVTDRNPRWGFRGPCAESTR